ncbi:hypothetical protein C7S18_21490 [Ahniella affigens]|uniref:Response regulatory domain-containing protein n=1 Tax=Ahniella affigens TaxID=2021234 RepID=A0A2P1PXL2_9GAMM|nr:hypothetical protein C7S18_21490 [Ahniella affigens]
MALLQTLPERLWRRTGIVKRQDAIPIYVGSKAAAQTSSQYIQEAKQPFEQGALNKRTHWTLPLLGLSEDWWSAYGRMINDAAPPNVPGLALPTDIAADVEQPSEPVQVGSDPTALSEQELRERLEQFKRDASPRARELLYLLCYVPLQLAIIRLVQRVTQGEQSGNGELSELFFSGLIRRISPPSELDPNRVSFNFHPPLRQWLQSEVPLGKAIQIKHLLSEFLKDRYGSGYDFMAEVSTGDLTEDLSFAEVRGLLARRLMPEPRADEQAVQGSSNPQIEQQQLSGRRILWIDDGHPSNTLEIDVLMAEGAAVDPVTSIELASKCLANSSYDALVADFLLDGNKAGELTFLDYVDERLPSIVRIVYPRVHQRDIALAAMQMRVELPSKRRETLLGCLVRTLAPDAVRDGVWPDVGGEWRDYIGIDRKSFESIWTSFEQVQRSDPSLNAANPVSLLQECLQAFCLCGDEIVVTPRRGMPAAKVHTKPSMQSEAHYVFMSNQQMQILSSRQKHWIQEALLFLDRYRKDGASLRRWYEESQFLKKPPWEQIDLLSRVAIFCVDIAGWQTVPLTARSCLALARLVGFQLTLPASEEGLFWERISVLTKPSENERARISKHLRAGGWESRSPPIVRIALSMLIERTEGQFRELGSGFDSLDGMLPMPQRARVLSSLEVRDWVPPQSSVPLGWLPRPAEQHAEVAEIIAESMGYHLVDFIGFHPDWNSRVPVLVVGKQVICENSRDTATVMSALSSLDVKVEEVKDYAEDWAYPLSVLAHLHERPPPVFCELRSFSESENWAWIKDLMDQRIFGVSGRIRSDEHRFNSLVVQFYRPSSESSIDPDAQMIVCKARTPAEFAREFFERTESAWLLYREKASEAELKELAEDIRFLCETGHGRNVESQSLHRYLPPRPRRNGRLLSANAKEAPLLKGAKQVELVVVGAPDWPIESRILFDIDVACVVGLQTEKLEAVQAPRHNLYIQTAIAKRPFKVGAICDGGATILGLDLASLPDVEWPPAEGAQAGLELRGQDFDAYLDETGYLALKPTSRVREDLEKSTADVRNVLVAEAQQLLTVLLDASIEGDLMDEGWRARVSQSSLADISKVFGQTFGMGVDPS